MHFFVLKFGKEIYRLTVAQKKKKKKNFCPFRVHRNPVWFIWDWGTHHGACSCAERWRRLRARRWVKNTHLYTGSAECTLIRTTRGTFSSSLHIWLRSKRQSAEFEYDIRKAETVQVCMQHHEPKITAIHPACAADTKQAAKMQCSKMHITECATIKHKWTKLTKRAVKRHATTGLRRRSVSCFRKIKRQETGQIFGFCHIWCLWRSTMENPPHSEQPPVARALSLVLQWRSRWCTALQNPKGSSLYSCTLLNIVCRRLSNVFHSFIHSSLITVFILVKCNLQTGRFLRSGRNWRTRRTPRQTWRKQTNHRIKPRTLQQWGGNDTLCATVLPWSNIMYSFIC